MNTPRYRFCRYEVDGPLLTLTIDRPEVAFCVGTDLKALALTGNHQKPPTGFAGITHRFDLWKPVIVPLIET